MRRLRPVHFGGQVNPQLFALLGRYLDMTGEVMTRAALQGFLEQQRSQAGTVAMYLEVYDQLAGTQATDGEFGWAVERLREVASEQATGEALSAAYEILTRGVEDKNGERVVGPEAARLHVLERFAAIDVELNQSESPEGDIRQEQSQIIGRFMKSVEGRKRQGGRTGIGTGVAAIDDLLGGGLGNGELALVAGFSSSGKTSLCVSTAWHACVAQGKNVVFFTSETLRPQVVNKLIARHSRHPQFDMELPDGIDSKRIREGSLSGPEIAAYSEVLRDFTDNPAYGKCYVAQVPWGATIGQVRSRLSRIGHLFEVHLCIIDYLGLLNSDRKRDTSHEETAQIVKDTKAMAATHEGGTGVPCISPWQVNRPGRDRALKEGSYAGIDLAGSAEAFNTPDVVLTLLEPAKIENPRACPVKGELLKNRDGPRGAVIPLKIDYATSFFRCEDGGSVSAPGEVMMNSAADIGTLMGG
jgi:replicative DNA helicase